MNWMNWLSNFMYHYNHSNSIVQWSVMFSFFYILKSISWQSNGYSQFVLIQFQFTSIQSSHCHDNVSFQHHISLHFSFISFHQLNSTNNNTTCNVNLTYVWFVFLYPKIFIILKQQKYYVVIQLSGQPNY